MTEVPREKNTHSKNLGNQTKVILVDLGGVVVTNGFWDWVDKLGVPKEERADFREIIDAADAGKISEEECMNQLSQLSNRPPEKVREELTQSFTPLSGMTELLEKINKRYPLVLVTNFMTSFANSTLDRYKLKNYFERIFISSVVKKAKPSTDFFEHVVKKMGLQPEDCLFIDDSERNIETAKTMGIQSALFINKEQLEGELRQRGLLD